MINTEDQVIKTEDQIIIAHTDRLINSTRISLDKFASDFLVPALEAAGIIKYDAMEHAGEYLHWRNRNCVQFHRVMRGTTKFPLSWKWPWVNNLPEPFRTECRRELLALAGVLDIPIPHSDAEHSGHAKSRISKIMNEFSHVVSAAAPTHDGILDGFDDPVATERYASELLDVLEEIKSELLAIKQGTGIVPTRMTQTKLV